MSNFPFYISQIKAQRYNKNNSVANQAVEVLSILDKRVQQKTGKKISQMSKEELAKIPFDINAKSQDHKKFWGSAGMFSYEENAHFLGFFGKKNRAKRKKLLGNIGKTIGNITKVIGKIVTSPAMAALLPFKNAMKNKLRKKGITPKSKIRDLAEQFYNNIIKSYDYEGYEAHYVEISGQEKKADAVPLTLIIPAIISFFKMIFQKKEDGTASPEEAALVEEVSAEQKKLDTNPEYKAQVIQENSLEKQSGSNKSIMWIVIAVIAFVALKKFM